MAGYEEWRQDVRNSKQRKYYTKALDEKLKLLQPMLSAYDSFYTPTGKKWGSGIHQKRIISLFSDGTFIAIEGKSQGFSLQVVTFISGKWSRETETLVSLQRQDGTNFIDYAFMDLSSMTNFPPKMIEMPFRVSPTYEVQRNLLLSNTNQVGEAIVTP